MCTAQVKHKLYCSTDNGVFFFNFFNFTKSVSNKNDSNNSLFLHGSNRYYCYENSEKKPMRCCINANLKWSCIFPPHVTTQPADDPAISSGPDKSDQTKNKNNISIIFVNMLQPFIPSLCGLFTSFDYLDGI